MTTTRRGRAMSQLTQDQYNDLPDYAKSAFTQDGDNFVPAKDAKLKGTLDDLDSKYRAAEQRAKEGQDRLDGYEKTKAADIAAATAKALEDAVTKGDSEEIKARHAQQMGDLRKRVEEETRQTVSQEYSLKEAKANAKNELRDIVAELKPIDAKSAQLIMNTLALRQQVTEAGEVIYLDDSGSATTLDRKSIVEDAIKGGDFDRLIHNNLATKGGGNANGSGSGSAAKRKFNEYDGEELMAMRKTDPSLYERLKSERNK
jgi:hypothetical protein